MIELERFECYELLHNKFYEWTSQAREDLEKSWNEYAFDESIFKPDKIAFFIITLDAFKHKFFSEISLSMIGDENAWRNVLNKKLSAFASQ